MNQTNSSDNIFVTDNMSSLTWDLYIRMVVAIFGILANIINVFVFLNSELKHITYKYMLANAINNIVYLSLSFASVLFYYCLRCPSSHTYVAAIMSIAFAYYFLDCLKLMHVLLQITISLRILFILLNKSLIRRTSYPFVLVLLTIVSMVFFVQEPFSVEIYTRVNQNGRVIYSTRNNRFGNSDVSKYLVLVQFAIRVLFAVVVLSFINILNVFEFKKRMHGKNRLFIRSIVTFSSGGRGPTGENLPRGIF